MMGRGPRGVDASLPSRGGDCNRCLLEHTAERLFSGATNYSANSSAIALMTLRSAQPCATRCSITRGQGECRPAYGRQADCGQSELSVEGPADRHDIAAPSPCRPLSESRLPSRLQGNLCASCRRRRNHASAIHTSRPTCFSVRTRQVAMAVWDEAGSLKSCDWLHRLSTWSNNWPVRAGVQCSKVTQKPDRVSDGADVAEMSPCGGKVPLPGGAGGHDRNHQQPARSLQEPHAAVRDLLCSRMPAPALCSGRQRVPRRPSVASTESRTRHRPLRSLLAGGSPRR